MPMFGGHDRMIKCQRDTIEIKKRTPPSISNLTVWAVGFHRASGSTLRPNPAAAFMMDSRRAALTLSASRWDVMNLIQKPSHVSTFVRGRLKMVVSDQWTHRS